MDPLEPNSEPEEIELEEQDLGLEIDNEMMGEPLELEMFGLNPNEVARENPNKTQIMIKEFKAFLLRSKKHFHDEFVKICSK